MMTMIFFIITAAQVVCFIQSIRNLQKTRASYEVLASLVIGGLVYDNLVLALGSLIGEGSLLITLNAGRFMIHALMTPLLIIWGYGVARRGGLGWAQGLRSHALFCTLAVLLLLLGVYSDIVRLSLELKVEGDLMRYVNVGGIKGPPIPAIVTILVLFGIGISLWRKNKSWGLALGSAVMFISAIIGVRVLSVGNMGEVAMSAGVLAGENAVLLEKQPSRFQVLKTV